MEDARGTYLSARQSDSIAALAVAINRLVLAVSKGAGLSHKKP
jgi:hypothetical protein